MNRNLNNEPRLHAKFMRNIRKVCLTLCAALAGAAFAQSAPEAQHADGAVVPSNGFSGGRHSEIELINNTRNYNFPVEVWGYRDGEWSYVGAGAFEHDDDDEHVHTPFSGALDYSYYEVSIPGASNIRASSMVRGRDLHIYLDAFDMSRTWSERELHDQVHQTIMDNMPRPAEAPDAAIVDAEVYGEDAEGGIIIVNNSDTPSFSVTIYGADSDRRGWDLVGTARVSATGERALVTGPRANLRRYDDFDCFAISVDGARAVDVTPGMERRDLVIYIDGVSM